MKVAAVRTRFRDPADFVARVTGAYVSAGATPTEAELLVPHSALATGWGRNVWNNNIGVIKANADWRQTGDYVELGGEEFVDGEHVRNSMFWRAYASLVDSARDLLRLLGIERYREARDLLRSGDPNWFEALGRAGFYTEPTERHMPRYLSVRARAARLRGSVSFGALGALVVIGIVAYLVWR